MLEARLNELRSECHHESARLLDIQKEEEESVNKTKELREERSNLRVELAESSALMKEILDKKIIEESLLGSLRKELVSKRKEHAKIVEENKIVIEDLDKQIEARKEVAEKLKDVEKRYTEEIELLNAVIERKKKEDEDAKIIKKQAEIMIANAKGELADAEVLRSETEKEKRGIDSLKKRFMFYARRMNKWYEKKGLKPPIELKF